MSQVTVFEVGPRDGLQNEVRSVSLRDKLFLISGLVRSGVRELELGSFVRKDRIPQMADTDQVFSAIRRGQIPLGQARAWSLVPNLQGLNRAMAAGVRQIAVFTATTDAFTKKNIGMTIQESLVEFSKIIPECQKRKILVRGYVSTVFGCPYEGKVKAQNALRVIEKLLDLGVFQVSVGDTIGVATPRDVEQVIKPLLGSYSERQIAVHFHDTRGTALANALRALELGVRTIDSSIGGLGGCPYAPGAAGNLATEDLVYMLTGMGVHTGIDLEKLCQGGIEFLKRIKRPLTSRYLQAFVAIGRKRNVLSNS